MRINHSHRTFSTFYRLLYQNKFEGIGERENGKQISVCSLHCAPLTVIMPLKFDFCFQ